MTAQTESDQRQDALASHTRRQVLAFLSRAPHPLGASAVADEFGLHVTTARFHLEQLENAGLLTRNVQHDGQRGRPRVTFSAVPIAEVEDALRQLNSVLVEALANDSDGGTRRARRAGERWSQEFTDSADVGGDDVEPLLRIFQRLGFDPELRADDERDSPRDDTPDVFREIALYGCPFRDAAVEHPDVVCSAHRGLMDGTVTRLGHGAGEATLHPFVQPELCVVHLHGALAAG